MLLAVEGGGFFSSSATGYSKGLALLLLGRRNEEKPMRVSPWNQYQLVEEEVDPDLQLASRKSRVSCRCARFICFGRASAGKDGPCPPKVGPIHQPETLADSSSASDTGRLCSICDAIDESERKTCLRSSLKKPSTSCSMLVGEADDAHDSLQEVPTSVCACSERRKVQWMDASGLELVEIREFEPSDAGSSDDEFGLGGERSCECVIQ
ncbi:uncharacterized protein LOC103704798 [Phoenix dactylifera]|uniref:Uncharacterized protein LOC103704798 n=1 Tax=Phoenix dactylifera TaxID=42345 RepID=A0A8B7BVY6_PHODC|nr:uncharacterized protein LOC103704798 [Phoenix dactylifera]XP_008786483.2 uncharacterized protein LOC103704798 [Phoenix dactylifera]XP_038986387.1 uncharacterized protein LOC103704798 [Phoenix dactylifera]XP_038986388.1 uncharacterized protein LOC103704798 [Phoenix dactylifera]